MLSFKNIQNADAVVMLLLKNLGVNIGAAQIEAELDKHPDYPSLLAISDVLMALDIRNTAFRIEPDNLHLVPCPFIAHTSLNGGDFIVVNKIGDKNFIVSSEKWNRHKISPDEFKKIFKGVVLTAEPPATLTTLTTTTTFTTKIKYPAIITGSLLMLLSALIFHTGYFTSLSWQLAALTLFKGAGLLTSILLLVQSIDKNNPLVQVLCQTKGKTNCNAILSSKAAKVSGWLSWSEVGFFYFAGTWLLLLFGGGSTAIWQTLAILNFISLPYTFYPIYYQARVAKQWCVLCCAVQALLWLEFVPLISYVSKNSLSFVQGTPFGGEGRGEALSAVLICMLAPVILWAALKPLFLKLQQLQPLKQQLRKFKYNSELFNKLLKDKPKHITPDQDWSVVLGNHDAPNIITMVSNPFCNPCSHAHRLLTELLNSANNIQARIVFTGSQNDKDKRNEIVGHLMALEAIGDSMKTEQALTDWYRQKNYAELVKKHPVSLNENIEQKLEKQFDWCAMADIIATPTVLVNGFELPGLYGINDLKYLLTY